MYCKYCGGQLQGEEKFCAHCGKPVNEEKTDSKTAQKDFCPRCGQALKEGESTCSFCGNLVGENAAPASNPAPAPAPQRPTYQGQAYVEKKGTGLGIAGICLAFLAPIVGIILGIIAIKQGKDSFNKTAVALGIVSIVVAVIMWIVNMSVLMPMMEELFSSLSY